MPDAEALLVKGGFLIVTALSMARFIWHEFNNLMNDVRRKRRQR
jgi:hypothetical protein